MADDKYKNALLMQQFSAKLRDQLKEMDHENELYKPHNFDKNMGSHNKSNSNS